MVDTTLMIGSLFFLGLAVVFCLVSRALSKSSDPATNYLNKDLACIFSFMAAFCMWIQWGCTYMHQMNPIIQPMPIAHHE